MISKNTFGELPAHNLNQPTTKSYKKRKRSKERDCRDRRQSKRSWSRKCYKSRNKDNANYYYNNSNKHNKH